MRSIKENNPDMGPETYKVPIPVTRQEAFVNGVYASVDEASAREQDRLRSEEGIIPTCKMGCCYCCRYHVLTNRVEAHTLAQYVRRVLSDDQIDGLRERTQRWHEWDHARRERYMSPAVDEQSDTSNEESCPCPLLVDGACIAYPVRPVVCRTHFVSSPSRLCRARLDPKSTKEAPVVLLSIVTATRPVSRAIRDHIEKTGVDFSRSQMLLPQWLAVEMNWDFAISV